MKALITIFFCATVLYSCTNSTNNSGNANNNSQKLTTSEPITIEYTNPVNGFLVRAIWLPEYFDNKFLHQYVGPAILTFTDTKSNTSYNVVHPEFAEIILPENEKRIERDSTSDAFKQMVKSNAFVQKMEYKLPALNKDFVDNTPMRIQEGYTQFVPFFFKEVTFDGKDELILSSAEISEKGGFNNYVYQLTDEHFSEMKEKPYSDFHNFYSMAIDGQKYDQTSIDEKEKSIYKNWLSGCCLSGEKKYTLDSKNGEMKLVYDKTEELKQ